MILKDFFTMVQKYQGKSDSQIEVDWKIVEAKSGDWQYYHDCWFIDGAHPWDSETQIRVNARYMKGWSTKNPFAYNDHKTTVVQPKKERRILNA